MNRKIKLSAIVAGLAAASLLLAACTPPAGGPPGMPGAQTNVADAEKVTVQTGTVENRIVATGKVVANASASVAFARNGTVKEVLVKEGDAVKAGQTLMRLDARELELTAEQQWANYLSAQATYSQTIKGPSEAEVKAANASISSAQSSIASAQASKQDLYSQPSEAELVQVKAELENARVELQQAQAAYDRRYSQDPASIGASQEGVSLEKATNSYNRAKAAYDAKFEQPTSAQVASANAQISSANAQIASARSTLDALQPVTETVQQREAQMQQAYVAWQQAVENINDATLIAPFDGIVTTVAYDKGDFAATGQTAVQVADFATPIFEADVDEADLGGIKVGQDAQVRLQTYPDQPISAKVETISTVGTNNGAVVNYKVRLSMGQADDAGDAQPVVLINMSGTSEIVTARASDALVVPNTAITIDGQTRRYTVDRLNADNTTEKIEIELGFRDANQAQILSGVSAGDTLVIPSRAVQLTDPTAGQ
jgi:multidrug efflux pump subunit AcrA (membrane-fusion protein)